MRAFEDSDATYITLGWADPFRLILMLLRFRVRPFTRITIESDTITIRPERLA